jgi:hypothetical protein
MPETSNCFTADPTVVLTCDCNLEHYNVRSTTGAPPPMCGIVVGPTLSALHAATPYERADALLGNFYTARGLTLPDVYRDLDHTRRVFVSMDMRVAEAMGQELIRTRFQVRL